LSTPRRPIFAHPIEEAFARILDFYGVEWQYEPRTFDLERDTLGRVTEAFAPDFYLPQQDLYVELTTLRPQLTREKNKKLRRMKELFPQVNVKIFKRQDLQELMTKYGLDQEAAKIRGTAAQENNW
jgi:hypothetical protein